MNSHLTASHPLAFDPLHRCGAMRFHLREVASHTVHRNLPDDLAMVCPPKLSGLASTIVGLLLWILCLWSFGFVAADVEEPSLSNV